MSPHFAAWLRDINGVKQHRNRPRASGETAKEVERKVRRLQYLSGEECESHSAGPQWDLGILTYAGFLRHETTACGMAA
jgi:hypothetical protein